MAETNKLKKYKRLFCLFTVLSACAIGFILYNSAQIPADSNARSHGIADVLRKLPFLANWLDDKSFHRFVRKAAHFTEYGMLGFFICGAEVFAYKIKGEKHIALCLLIPIMTAVTDEYIQSFVGRTSSVNDVVIDFCGAVCGLTLMWAVLLLAEKSGHRKKK